MDVDPLLKLCLSRRGRWRSSTTPCREKTVIPRKMSTFSRSTREKNLFVCSFITMIAPSKSTLGNWEVMYSIPPYEIIKKHDFAEEFECPTGDPEVTSFIPVWAAISPCPVDGGGEVPQLLVEKILRYLGKSPLFRVQTERKKISSALLLPLLPPSTAH